MGIRTKLNPTGGSNRKKPFTDVMKYTVSVSDNGYVNLPVSQTTYTPDTVIKIDWGDGSTQQLEQGVAVSKNNIHQYTTAGEYQISICTRSNSLRSLSFRNDKNIVTVDSPILNVTKSGSLQYLFSNSGLTSFPVDLFALNPTKVNIRSCFSYTEITSIPRGFTAYLPRLSTVSALFEMCSLSDITHATNFLIDLKQYNTEIDGVTGSMFERCPFTKDIDIRYAQAYYDINGTLESLCARWLINYIPYDIINQFNSNTSISSMFSYGKLSGSIQLQEIPSSVTDVSNMFDTTNITSVSGTFGVNSNVLDYSNIFYGCYNLVTVQDDFVTAGKPIVSIAQMFTYTTSIQSIPQTLYKGKNFTKCDLGQCLCHPSLVTSKAFEGSSFSSDTSFSNLFLSLYFNIDIPEQFFQGCVTDPDSYLTLGDMLHSYSSNIPEDLFDYFNCSLSLTNVLQGCNADYIPDSLFNNLKIRSCSYILGRHLPPSNITQLPSKMFQGCTFTSDTISFNETFRDNSYITQVPQDVFDGIIDQGKPYNFQNCFRNCTNITSAVPELWNRTDMNIVSHTGCFRGCTNAANYNDIPDDWK